MALSCLSTRRFTSLFISLAFILLTSTTTLAINQIQRDKFLKACENASGKQDKSMVCRRWVEKTEDLELLCMIEDIWYQIAPEKASDYFRIQHEQFPDRSDYMLLFGRLSKDPFERLRLARQIVAQRPDSLYGYRLLTETYLHYFLKGTVADSSRRRDLWIEFEKDYRLSEKWDSIETDSSRIVEFLYQSMRNFGQPVYADELLTLGRLKEWEWAVLTVSQTADSLVSPPIYLFHEPEDRPQFDTPDKGGAGSPDSRNQPRNSIWEEMESAEDQGAKRLFLLFVGGKTREALDILKALPSEERSLNMLFLTAGCWARIEQPDSAYFWLELYINKLVQEAEDWTLAASVENPAWIDPRWIDDYPDFSSLKSDRRWSGIRKRLESTSPAIDKAVNLMLKKQIDMVLHPDNVKGSDKILLEALVGKSPGKILSLDVMRTSAKSAQLREMRAFEQAKATVDAFPHWRTNAALLMEAIFIDAATGKSDTAIALLDHYLEINKDMLILDNWLMNGDLANLEDHPRWRNLRQQLDDRSETFKEQMTALLLKAFEEEAAKSPEEDESSPPPVFKPRPAPDFSLPGLNGTHVKLSELKGKVVVLDFWASWCVPCKRAMPEINSFTNNTDPEEVEVLSINVFERRRGEGEVYFTGKQFLMTLLFGDDDVARAYGVESIPHLFLIDKKGIIRHEEVGYGRGLGRRLQGWVQDLK